MARSFVKREIVWRQEPGTRVAVDRHLRPFGNPPPVIGACVRFECCCLLEQLLIALKEEVFSSVLSVFIVLSYHLALFCSGEDAYGSDSGPYGQGWFGIHF